MSNNFFIINKEYPRPYIRQFGIEYAPGILEFQGMDAVEFNTDLILASPQTGYDLNKGLLYFGFADFASGVAVRKGSDWLLKIHFTIPLPISDPIVPLKVRNPQTLTIYASQVKLSIHDGSVQIHNESHSFLPIVE